MDFTDPALVRGCPLVRQRPRRHLADVEEAALESWPRWRTAYADQFKRHLTTVKQVKQEILSTQYRAAIHINSNLALLYYSISHVINVHRNGQWVHRKPCLRYSAGVYKHQRVFCAQSNIWQSLLRRIPWLHNTAVLDKCKGPERRTRCIGAAAKTASLTVANDCGKSVQL